MSERIDVAVLNVIPSVVSPYSGFTKPREEKVGEYSAKAIIASTSSLVLEIDRNDPMLFPFERSTVIVLNGTERYAVTTAVALPDRWQIVAERLLV